MKHGLRFHKSYLFSKKWLATSIISSSLLTTPSFAGDMGPIKTQNDPNWTGFHINVGGGYGMFNHNSYISGPGSGPTVPPYLPVGVIGPITAVQTAGGKGGLGRLGGGYDYQFFQRFVVGGFADYDFMNPSGLQAFPGVVGKIEQNRAWYVGGLLGYTFTPSTLTFIDAGYTGTHLSSVNYSIAIAGGGPVGLTLDPQTFHGWFLGLGLETLLTSWKSSNLFLRAEYRYSGYGSENTSFTGGASSSFVVPAGITLPSKVSTQTAAMSLVWRLC